jgi:hypothetical protein
VKDATPDLAQINAWWQAWPDANIGLACGDSGLFVLDVDGPEGEAALAALPPLPPSAACATARGRHVYFTGDGPSTVSRLGPKLDTRGRGGYVILPPSAHASGATYAWTEAPWDVPAAALPAWIPAELERTPAANTSRGTAGAVLAGARNATLTTLAGVMRRRGLDGVAIAAALQAHNAAHCTPPLEPREVDAIARSVERYEPTALVVVPQQDARAARKTLRAQAKRVQDDPALLEDAVRHTAAHVQTGAMTVTEVATNFERALAASPIVRAIPRPELELLVATAPAAPLEAEPWHAALLAGDDGPAYGPENLGRLFEGHPECQVWWNSRAQRAEWARCPWGAPPGPVGECDFELRRWLERTVGWPKTPVSPSEALYSVARKTMFDPWKAWLEGLRWDGVERLLTAAPRLLAAEHPTAGVLFGWWLLSAVARTFEPGCQVDHMIVLEGGMQGEGKTTFLRELAMDPQFFTRMTTQGDLTHFRTIGKIHGPVIVEVAEMAALRGRDVESAKAWIDERSDRWQPAYARVPQDTPRACVFAATVNPGQYLHDDRNRRFWPIACGPRIDLDGLRAEREQLWAEAVHWYRAGTRWYPTPEESTALGLHELQDSRRDVDLLEETLHEVLQTPRAGAMNALTGERFAPGQLGEDGLLVRVTTAQLSRLLGDRARTNGNAIARAMRALKWRVECLDGTKWWTRTK